MYARFYNLKENPFSLTPDPKYCYLSDGHREVLASMIYGVNERKSLVVVIGEVGTGKTMMLRMLMNHFNERAKTIYLFNVPHSFDELLMMSLEELGINHRGKERNWMLLSLSRFLVDQDRQGNKVVMIIDEAQNLNHSTLEELRALSNLETEKRKLLQIILVGQPELDLKLNHVRLRQLKDQINIRSELLPLTAREIEKYIYHRLRIAGNNGSNIFSKAALKHIAEYSQGIPRKMNVLCDNALLIGYATERRKISKEVIKEVVIDFEGRNQRQGGSRGDSMRMSPRSKYWHLSTTGSVLIVVLLIAIVSFLIMNYWHKFSDKNLTQPQSIKKENSLKL